MEEKKVVYACIMNCEFDCSENQEISLYDSYEKAHKCFIEALKEWDDEGLFNGQIFESIDSNDFKEHDNNDEEDEYEVLVNFTGHENGCTNRYFIRERDNIYNFVDVKVMALPIL